jgi:hypothetical protein
MDELRQMIGIFRDKYVYQRSWGDIVGINSDNELICKMFEEVASRIDAIEKRQGSEDEE